MTFGWLTPPVGGNELLPGLMRPGPNELLASCGLPPGGKDPPGEAPIPLGGKDPDGETGGVICVGSAATGDTAEAVGSDIGAGGKPGDVTPPVPPGEPRDGGKELLACGLMFRGSPGDLAGLP